MLITLLLPPYAVMAWTGNTSSRLLPKFLDAASSSYHVTSNVSTSSEWWIQNNTERSHTLICVEIPGETEDNQRNSRPERRSPAQDLNPAPPGCKVGVLISLFTIIFYLLNTYLHIHRNQYAHPSAIKVHSNNYVVKSQAVERIFQVIKRH
jgi:hypothetical protein